MIWKFTLYNANLGTLEIREPIGWDKCTQKLERDENFHSLIEYFDGDFIFTGNNGEDDGGLDFLKAAEQIGINEEVTFLAERSYDGIQFVTAFSGQVDLSTAEQLKDNQIKFAIIRDDFWAKFISRLDTPVDLQSTNSLDGDFVSVPEHIRLKLTPQALQMKYAGKSQDNDGPFTGVERWEFDSSNTYGIIDFPVEDLDEIEQKFHYPIIESPTLPFELFKMDYAGTYYFDIYITLWSINEYTPAPGSLKAYFKINNTGTPIELTRTDFATVLDGMGNPIEGRSVFQHSGNHTLSAGDYIYLYLKGDGSTYSVIQPKYSVFQSYMNVTGQTIGVETNAQSLLLHDAGAIIADRIIGEQGSFYSPYLGSSQTTERQYDEDGCGWTFALVKGLQLREYTLQEKPFFLSFKQWWDGINPILNLGLGYTTITDDNGETKQVIEVDEKSAFYGSTPSVYIDNVRDIRRVYDKERLFNKVVIGYKKWQSEDISGIDDPQTKHEYSTILKRAGKTETIESGFIAASLAIETTRRTTRKKSADYKFDNDTFIISINPNQVNLSPETSPDVQDFAPELDENFSSITNLLNSDTRYNSRLTPGWNFTRWSNYLQGCLQSYLTSVFKFVSGEGNYDMVSTLSDCDSGTVNEKGDISVTDDFLHLPLLYEISVIDFDADDYDIIKANPKKPIAISQTDEDHVNFHIRSLEYSPAQGTAVITASPVSFMDILVIDTILSQIECISTAETCDDGYLTEIGQEFETEDENCLILD